MHSPSDAKEDAAAFRRYLTRVGRRIDRTLDRVLPAVSRRPQVIHEAMRYTALSQGKRLRPVMAVLAYETAGGTGRKVDRLAAALEIVHAFSLIHDDLPAMDDDDFRRGQPSNHKVFGEGVAILAGDALLARAFWVLARLGGRGGFAPEVVLRVVEELTDATGTEGVIGGQVLDLLFEGKKASRATVTYIHRNKTGRLFVTALRMGAIAAEAPTGLRNRLTRYGENLGLAFQIVDDILNAAGTFRELGRDPGRDRAKGKATYPAVVGMTASHRAVDRLLREARREADRLPRNRELFRGLVELVDDRRRDEDGALLAAGSEA